jgi:Aldo/keto reductase family
MTTTTLGASLRLTGRLTLVGSAYDMGKYMTHQLGSRGSPVFPPALGRMGKSGMSGKSEDDESVATIHAALDQGVTLLDTGDFDGMGHNEILLGCSIVPVIDAHRRTELIESVRALRFGPPQEDSGRMEAAVVETVMTNIR